VKSGKSLPRPALDITVVIAHAPWRRSVRAPAALCRQAAEAALAAAGGRSRRPCELAVLLGDDESLRVLNRTYRGMDKPTNVLSFTGSDEAGLAGKGAPHHLGDIALAYETVTREAKEQGKPLRHHLLHLVVHGTLHLLGRDHERPAEAEAMEELERRILARIGVGDPYRWRGEA